MTLSWAALEQMAKGRRHIPAGFKLEYEFRPSLSWYPNIHQVHAYWKKKNADKAEGEFWHLEPGQQLDWQRQYLDAKYRVFRGRSHFDCAWQRFTLTDIHGKQFILQMDSKGHVDQLKEVEVTQKILVKA